MESKGFGVFEHGSWCHVCEVFGDSGQAGFSTFDQACDNLRRLGMIEVEVNQKRMTAWFKELTTAALAK